ncbi:MAG: YesL family protein [Roseburia sp.]
MGQLFNVENKVFQESNKLVDGLMLNLLWLMCCLPLGLNMLLALLSQTILLLLPCVLTAVPAGVATTAVYYTVNKVIRQERGYAFREFWQSFLGNLKQGAVITMLYTVMALVIFVDGYIMYRFVGEGEKIRLLYLVFVMFFGLLMMWGIYLFPHLARFENSTKKLMKNAALMAIADLPKTLVLFALLLACAALCYKFPFALLFVPVLYIYIQTGILEKIFRKYMSEEDLAAEDERNQTL